ncbi:MAG: hypothetical protein FWE06_09475 [Oscillospiraceae bacterium]|nr:hypothetical protein [Oscillospiraceae bacterium]
MPPPPSAKSHSLREPVKGNPPTAARSAPLTGSLVYAVKNAATGDISNMSRGLLSGNFGTICPEVGGGAVSESLKWVSGF